MKLEHSFTVPAPVDTAWAALLDIEGVAPCFPGATLTGVDGEQFTGTVRVKLGPVSLTYGGTGRFLERDDAQHRAVIEAKGRDRNGNGTAGATVRAHLEPQGPAATRVVVSTDLTVTGRPAQFGRGVIQDVGGRIIDQFAGCLAATMAGPGPGPDDAQPPPAAAAPLTLAAAGPRTAPARPAAPRPPALRPAPSSGPAGASSGTWSEPSAAADAGHLDLGSAVLPALLRRLGPPALVALVSGLLAWRLVRRLRRRR